MPLGWLTPVVWPSWSLALAKPADLTLSSIKIFQTWPSTLILIRSSTVSEWRDALVQWFVVQYHLLVLVHCVFWKPTSLHPFTNTFWSTSCSCFLLLTSFLKMLISFSRRIWHRPHCQKHQRLVKWPWCWCAWLASKLTRSEPHRESDHLHATLNWGSN